MPDQTTVRRATEDVPFMHAAPLTTTLREVPADPADLDARGVRHSALVRELAFACWVEANGNAERARRLLVAACERDQTGRLPQEEAAYPSANAIRRWARRDGWELQLIESIGAGYGHLLKLAAARLLQVHSQALDVLDEVTSPGYVPQKDDKVRVDAAKHVTTLMGQVLSTLQAGQQALSQHAGTAEANASLDAVEANRLWIKGGKE